PDERIGDIEPGGGVEGRLRPEGAHRRLRERQDGERGDGEDRQELRAAFHAAGEDGPEPVASQVRLWMSRVSSWTRRVSSWVERVSSVFCSSSVTLISCRRGARAWRAAP